MKKTLIIILLTISAVFTAFSQTNDYVLADIIYDIKGFTKPFFIEQRLEYKLGDQFHSIEEVDNFRHKITQDLENLRVFEDIKVETEVISHDIILHIYLDDAWGIIPFGLPKYNSETGGRVAMKLFWYNSLGTLTNSLLSGGVNVAQNPVTSELEIQTWDAQFSIDEILIMGRFYNIAYKQSLERESKDDKIWSFHNSELSLGTTFSLFGNFNYSPAISATARYNYKPVEDSIKKKNIPQNPLTLSYSHGIGRNNINWIGNFRDGYSYGLGNSISLLYDKSGEIKPTTDFTITGSYYKTFGDLPISLGTKLTGIFSINNEMLGLGSRVRGIISGDLYGHMGIFSSNNLFLRVIKIDNIAEAIFGPHFDYGITDNMKPKYGAGGDFILYVDKFKSLVARASISIDLTKFNPDTFSLKDLEIDITSNLFF